MGTYSKQVMRYGQCVRKRGRIDIFLKFEFFMKNGTFSIVSEGEARKNQHYNTCETKMQFAGKNRNSKFFQKKIQFFFQKKNFFNFFSKNFTKIIIFRKIFNFQVKI